MSPGLTPPHWPLQTLKHRAEKHRQKIVMENVLVTILIILMSFYQANYCIYWSLQDKVRFQILQNTKTNR